MIATGLLTNMHCSSTYSVAVLSDLCLNVLVASQNKIYFGLDDNNKTEVMMICLSIYSFGFPAFEGLQTEVQTN